MVKKKKRNKRAFKEPSLYGYQWKKEQCMWSSSVCVRDKSRAGYSPALIPY